jgi:hypothetical protein
MKWQLLFSPLALAVKPQLPKVSSPDVTAPPQTPGADALLSDYAQIAKGIGSDTAQLLAQVKQLEVQNLQKLSKQKVFYDDYLKKQEAANMLIQKTNAMNAEKVADMHKGNLKILNAIVKIREMKKLRSAELLGMDKQFARARLAVRRGMAETKMSAQDAEDTSSGDEMRSSRLAEPAGLSFLEMEMEAAPAKPTVPSARLDVDLAEVPADEPEAAASKKEDPAKKEDVTQEDPALAALVAPTPDLAEGTKDLDMSAAAVQADPAPRAKKEQAVAPAEAAELAPASGYTNAALEGADQASTLMGAMSHKLAQLDSTARQSQQRQKKLFQKSVQAGKKRHEVLLRQGQALAKKFRGMKHARKQLEVLLDKERKAVLVLEKRVKDLSSFLGSLQRVVQSPLSSVPQALQAAEAERV